MERLMLSDEQWNKIEPFLAGKESDCGVTARNSAAHARSPADMDDMQSGAVFTSTWRSIRTSYRFVHRAGVSKTQRRTAPPRISPALVTIASFVWSE